MRKPNTRKARAKEKVQRNHKCVEMECNQVLKAAILGKDNQRGKCKCVELNWKVVNLKFGKERANDEIEDLKFKCSELIEKEKVIASERDKSEKERITCLEKCAQLSKDIEDLKLRTKRDTVQIADLRKKCMELEIHGTVSLKREVELGKELEDYKTKCQGLSAELEQKKGELENLLVINVGLDHEREDYRTKCIRMEDQIKGLVEEGSAMSERETSAHERIRVLEEVVKEVEANKRETSIQLNTENRKLECGNKRVEDDNFGGLTKRFKESETQTSRVEEENSTLRGLPSEVSCEKTYREMDGRVDAANVAHLTRTETSPNSTFIPSCTPSSLKVDFDVHVSESPHVYIQSESAENAKDYPVSASGHQVGFETEGSPGENLVLLKQDGGRASTTCFIDISEDEIVDISDSEGENEIL